MASFKINKGVGVFSEGTTKVGKVAYYGFTGLTGVILPDSVTEVGDCAFENCIVLKSVSLGNSVERIGDRAFFGCTSLTSIVIPDSVTEIGQRAFENCIALKSVTLGDSVKSVGNSTFRNCRDLTSITIPDKVTRIGEDAFSGCTGLASINVPAYMVYYYKSLLPKELLDKIVVTTTTVLDNSDQEKGTEFFGKYFWQRSDFNEIAEDVLTQLVNVCCQTNAKHDDFYDFVAQGYLYRRDEFLQYAVKRIEPDFDFWQNVYNRLPEQEKSIGFFIALLDDYRNFKDCAPGDMKWFEYLYGKIETKHDGESLLFSMNYTYDKTNDRALQNQLVELAVSICEGYNIDVCDYCDFEDDEGVISESFAGCILSEIELMNEAAAEGYYEYDKDYKDCQDGPYDCFREDEHHDDEGEPCDDCQDDENRTVSYVTLHNMKDIPSTANVNRMMNEARLDEEREARLRRKPIETSTEPEDSTDKDSSSQWFPGLLVFILILIALAVYFSSIMP